MVQVKKEKKKKKAVKKYPFIFMSLCNGHGIELFSSKLCTFHSDLGKKAENLKYIPMF